MGKTTLARLATDRPIIGSDAYRELPWGDIPAAMFRDTQGLERFVIEGVQVARALRGQRVGNLRLPGITVDAVVYLRQPKVPIGELLDGHIPMAIGVRTIFESWRTSGVRLPPIYEEPQVIPRT